MTKTAIPTIFCGFGSLMDIDKLILGIEHCPTYPGFGSLMDIDKLIPQIIRALSARRFGSLMDIDKLIPPLDVFLRHGVLVL